MKRCGKLFEHLTSWPNLLQAAYLAARGKRFRANVARFNFDLERELLRLESELVGRHYTPGAYRTFIIHIPKRRLISAAPFRDRVVHHALCNVLEPIFERSFVFDSYACRKGKGSHAAVTRCQKFLRRFRYCLQADIRKFFPSIDHEILKNLLARKVKDEAVLWLAGRIIDCSNLQEPVCHRFPGDDLFTPLERRRGLPIGNQTSQFFANVYLNPLDHYLKDHLGAAGYVRYVDDFVIFSNDKSELAEVRSQIAAFLATLRLKLNPQKTVIFPSTQGVPFLGFRVFHTHRLLAKENVKRFRRRMMWLQQEYALGLMSAEKLRQRIASWNGHAAHADSYHLRARLFGEFAFSRAAANRENADVRVADSAEPGQPDTLHAYGDYPPASPASRTGA